MAEPDSRNGSSGSGLVGTLAAVAVLAVSAGRVASTPDPEAVPVATNGIILPEPASGLMGKVDRYQRSKNPLAFVVGVIKKFGDDKGGKLAALVAYYGFFSLFPAMLALVTVLGFVLEGRDDLRQRIAESALGQFPVIGDQLSDTINSPLSGSPIALTIGIAGALWAGMGAMQAAQDAMNDIWDVRHAQMPNFFLKRLKSLILLGTIGLLLIATAITPQIIGAVTSGIISDALVQLAAVALDIGVFAVAFRVLTVADLSWKDVLPGACIAGTIYAILQIVGRFYITNTVNGAQNTYGTFALVIGLLSWMFLVAQIMMLSAEVNSVIARRLWPRSLSVDSLTPNR
ncbi:MAG: YihY/virulence factor BrkB family protein [Ilumatobacteraceae bacterium]